MSPPCQQNHSTQQKTNNLLQYCCEQDWTMFYCPHCSTIMFSVVTPNSGSTVLFHIVDNLLWTIWAAKHKHCSILLCSRIRALGCVVVTVTPIWPPLASVIPATLSSPIFEIASSENGSTNRTCSVSRRRVLTCSAGQDCFPWTPKFGRRGGCPHS